MKTTPLHKNTTAAMTLGFTGVAGFHFWTGNQLNEDGSFPVNLWKPIYRAQAHMNGQDVVSTLSQGGGYWRHGKQKAENDGGLFHLFKKYAVAQQYYISNDRKMAVGYIKNRTYNIKTRGIDNLCTNYNFSNKWIYNNGSRNTKWNKVKKKEKLRINHLEKKTKYRIDWYSAFRIQNNGYLKTDCIKTKKKKNVDGTNGKSWTVMLKYPELTVSEIGTNDLPAVWFVMRKGCNSGMTQHTDPKQAMENLRKNREANLNQNSIISIKVYPNPFQNTLIIQSPKDDKVFVFSIEGKRVLKTKVESGSNKLSLTNIARGLYFVRFINQHQTIKVVKK